jgi:hypothetical protein
MSTRLPIELSEHAFAVLSQQASAVGKTPAELAASVVETIYAGQSAPQLDPETARAQFELCFGSVDLGRPIGITNDAIDADLARLYGTTNGSA